MPTNQAVCYEAKKYGQKGSRTHKEKMSTNINKIVVELNKTLFPKYYNAKKIKLNLLPH